MPEQPDDEYKLPEYHDDEGNPDDVPFKLPLAEDYVPDEDETADWPAVDENDPAGPLPIDPRQPTRPIFREPGQPDPKATLPGSGGLDPNPDMAGFQSHQQATARHPAVRGEEGATVPHPIGQGHTVPHTPTEDHSPYQRPAPKTIVSPRVNYTPPAPPGQSTSPKSRPTPKRRRKRAFRPGCLWIFGGVFVTFCGGLFCIVSLLAITLGAELEEQLSAEIAGIDDYESFQSTFIYDRHGTLLYEVFGEGRRVAVPYERFPQHLINATIAIEDDSFWENPGIDVGATFVAMMQYLGASPDEQTAGGSTITQQLIRNVLFDFEYRAERSVERKVREILLAILLTQRKSKQEILELYLNEIYYGNLAYGAQTAAQTFFGKNVEDLTLGEAALLASLPQAPADLDPLNPDPEIQARLYQRWQMVLNEMVEEGYITQTEADAAFAQGLTFVPPQSSLQAPHFTVYAQQELEQLMRDLGYSPEDIARGGLQVYTTLDLNINNMALQAARQQVAQLRDRHNVSNAAVVVLKPLTGEIMAMVGSIDYNNDAIDGRVNVTTALRQPGSTMKPFTYSAAMERGMTPGDVIWDVPTEIDNVYGGAPYRPVNYDRAYHGPMRMRQALANSYNIPAVQTLRLVGVDYLLQLMRRFGVVSLGEDASRYGLSLTLGGGEVSPLELTNAFAVFANSGAYVPATSILCVLDKDDNIIYEYENGCPQGNLTANSVQRMGFGEQVLDPRIAFIISDILADNTARSPAMGSNSPLRTDGIISSVKTGTTDDFKDNWTMGFTRNVAVGVWVGNNNGDPMVNTSGLSGAAPIWNTVLTNIYNNSALLGAFASDNGQLLSDQLVPPPGVTLRRLCDVRRLTDPSPNCPATVSEWLLDGPAGVPDGNGGLYYPVQQTRMSQPPPVSGSYVQEIEPGIFRTLAYPLPPEIANGIQFNVAPGERRPPPPKYCRVPVELAAQAVGAQELLFIAPPATSQKDAVAAEEYAQANGLAFLPTIDCTPELLVPPINYGPNIVTAIITSPTPGQVLTGPTPIIGTVQFSPEVQFYKLEIIGPNFPDWTTFGSTHNQSVINGQLEELYVPSLQPGNYQIRLILINNNGGVVQQPYVVPIRVER